MRTRVIGAVQGRSPFSLVIRNVRIVNVYNDTVTEGSIGIVDDRIAYAGPMDFACQAEEELDGGGCYALPGFVDAHMHLESSMLTPAHFAEVVLACGTTTVAADPHEIGNVLGLEGVRALMEAAGLTQERVAERLGKSRPAVANLLRLLTLPEEVQKMLVDGRLTAGHARALVTVDPSRQVQLANLTVQQNWSVRQLERICAQPVKPAPKPRPRPDRELTELEDMARDLFGTRARIDGDKNRGKLVISYYSADDLQRIWEALEAARR